MYECNILVAEVRRRWGIAESEVNAFSGGDGGTSNAAAPGVAAAAAEVKVKTEFAVKLLKFNEKDKIKVIKEVRTITGLGLKEVWSLLFMLHGLISRTNSQISTI